MQRPSPDAESPYSSYWRQLGETVAAIFVVAVLGNYPWELAQAPLYAGMESFRTVAWHCFVASLGDGLLVLVVACSLGTVHAQEQGKGDQPTKPSDQAGEISGQGRMGERGQMT